MIIHSENIGISMEMSLIYIYDQKRAILISLTTECEVSSEKTLGVSIRFKSVSGSSHSGISSNGREEMLGIGERLKVDKFVFCDSLGKIVFPPTNELSEVPRDPNGRFCLMLEL